MKPTYVMTITVGGAAVTRADLENAVAKLKARWGETTVIEATIHKARARRKAAAAPAMEETTNA